MDSARVPPANRAGRSLNEPYDLRSTGAAKRCGSRSATSTAYRSGIVSDAGNSDRNVLRPLMPVGSPGIRAAADVTERPRATLASTGRIRCAGSSPPATAGVDVASTTAATRPATATRLGRPLPTPGCYDEHSARQELFCQIRGRSVVAHCGTPRRDRASPGAERAVPADELARVA